MPERKGPTESATKFPVGAVRQGNDGVAWAVAATKTGVRRWRRVSQKDGGRAAKGGCGCGGPGAPPTEEVGVEGGAGSRPTKGKRRVRKGRVRKGPTPSATLFALHTRKKGNDGPCGP